METWQGDRMVVDCLPRRPRWLDYASAAARPATVPLDQLQWKSNAGSTARPSVAIEHYVLPSASMTTGRVTGHDL
jgi:hypothetical protein